MVQQSDPAIRMVKPSPGNGCCRNFRHIHHNPAVLATGSGNAFPEVKLSDFPDLTSIATAMTLRSSTTSVELCTPDLAAPVPAAMARVLVLATIWRFRLDLRVGWPVPRAPGSLSKPDISIYL